MCCCVSAVSPGVTHAGSRIKPASFSLAWLRSLAYTVLSWYAAMRTHVYTACTRPLYELWISLGWFVHVPRRERLGLPEKVVLLVPRCCRIERYMPQICLASRSSKWSPIRPCGRGRYTLGCSIGTLSPGLVNTPRYGCC